MAIEIGYALSGEKHSPRDLVHYAKRVEETGFSFALISDHYHPWLNRQRQSPSVSAAVGDVYSAVPYEITHEPQ